MDWTNVPLVLGMAIAAVAGWFFGLAPVFQIYAALMLLDGLAALAIDIGPGGTGLSSDKIGRSFRLKIMGLLMIVTGAVMGVYVGLPAGQWIAGGLAFQQAVCIAEHAASLGVLPEPYNQILAIFRAKLPVESAADAAATGTDKKLESKESKSGV